MGQQFAQSYSVNFSYQKTEKDDSWKGNSLSNHVFKNVLKR